jgi:hypothetical protein
MQHVLHVPPVLSLLIHHSNHTVLFKITNYEVPHTAASSLHISHLSVKDIWFSEWIIQSWCTVQIQPQTCLFLTGFEPELSTERFANTVTHPNQPTNKYVNRIFFSISLSITFLLNSFWAFNTLARNPSTVSFIWKNPFYVSLSRLSTLRSSEWKQQEESWVNVICPTLFSDWMNEEMYLQRTCYHWATAPSRHEKKPLGWEQNTAVRPPVELTRSKYIDRHGQKESCDTPPQGTRLCLTHSSTASFFILKAAFQNRL